MMTSFNETKEFQKDFKRLKKKYRSLSDDLLDFQKVIAKIPLGSGKHFAILASMGSIAIIKARFFCRYLKGSSLRIIYAYCSEKKCAYFIELYSKNNKENEDSKRIKNFLKEI